MGKDYAAWGLTTTASGIELRVLVQPRASRNAILGSHDGATRIALTAAPVEGTANAALLVYLADLFAVSKRSVTLVRGQTARAKLVRVEDIGIDQALSVLLKAVSSLGRRNQPTHCSTDKRTNEQAQANKQPSQRSEDETRFAPLP